MAKVALLPRHEQQGRAVSSFVYLDEEFIAGEPSREVATQIGVMYMLDPNVTVEFTDEDFKGLDDYYLDLMAERLNCAKKDIKKNILPKKTVTTKVKETVKSTLTSTKTVETKPVEEPTAPVESDE